MNVVNHPEHSKTDYYPKRGDILVSECGELYILAGTTAVTYAAIALRDGNRFRDPVVDIAYAVADLKLFKRAAKITIQ